MHLIHCRHIGSGTIRKILSKDPGLKTLYSQSVRQFHQLLQISHQTMDKFTEEFQRIDIKKLLAIYDSHGISAITYEDDDYPPLLKEIYDPPLVLFTMGNRGLLQKKALAIVGARTANEYGEQAIRTLLPPLLDEGIVIVSGLAKGADTFAHCQTISLGGETIAVLGGGFFHLYPSENKNLAAKIANDHLLVSEYPPIWRPAKWHFPMRNRIISGLSLGTVVVQAKKRSGSLITADFALEEGREVFAVPGPVGDPLSEGTNHLIQQGAKLVRSGTDILEEVLLY